LLPIGLATTTLATCALVSVTLVINITSFIIHYGDTPFGTVIWQKWDENRVSKSGAVSWDGKKL